MKVWFFLTYTFLRVVGDCFTLKRIIFLFIRNILNHGLRQKNYLISKVEPFKNIFLFD